MMDIQSNPCIRDGFNKACYTTTDIVSPYNRIAMREAYSELSRQQRPTALPTLTVKEPNSPHAKWQVPDSTLLHNVKKLLHWVNIKWFGRKYMEKGLGLRVSAVLKVKQITNLMYIWLLRRVCL